MELLEFLNQVKADIKQEMDDVSDTQNGTAVYPETVFTEVVLSHLYDIGMTFEPSICHYSAKVGAAKLKLSGYAISEDMDQLDLFVSLYSDVNEIVSIPDSDTTRAAQQCLRFLTMCVDGKLHEKMDETSEAYPLVLTINETYSTLEQVRIFVLTDKKAKAKQFKPRELEGKLIKLEVVDIGRLFNHWQEGKPRDELVINFNEVAGVNLPCVWIPNEMEEYDYALTALPGEALRFLYEKYGPRILEANVRSFLSQLGKVNKGIRDTLREQPERFMAYNNGIVVIADEIALDKCSNGGVGISWLKGMQIVNGGQTTASMYFTKKKYPAVDLSNVRVPAKIIVLKKTDNESEDALITDISRYANSQNVVRQSDLAANNPYHISLESLARTTFCPDGESRWFYERAAGSYKVMLEREGKTQAGIKRLKKEIPTSRKIIKTDLAKFLNAWDEKPEFVSQGGQKNFQEFMRVVSERDLEQEPIVVSEFKEIVAKVLLFKNLQTRIRKEFPAFQANITAYLVSSIARVVGHRIDFNLIWVNQGLSDQFIENSVKWATIVNVRLHETSRGRMVSEWAKKKECWDVMSKIDFPRFELGAPELQNESPLAS